MIPVGNVMTLSATEPITCFRPTRMGLPMFEFSMQRLFFLFNPVTIVRLVTCALLEKQIIVHSTGKSHTSGCVRHLKLSSVSPFVVTLVTSPSVLDYELLVMVSECITALMYPFAWMHVYVPILPSTALHFIEAPMPYIMGLHTDVVADAAADVRLAGVWALWPSHCTGAAVTRFEATKH